MRLQAWRVDAVSALFLCCGAPDRWQADGDKSADRRGSTSLSGDSKSLEQLFVAEGQPWRLTAYVGDRRPGD